jgi:methionyl aminopeptidase
MAAKKPIYKTDEEIALIKESSLLIDKTLAALAPLVKPGVTPLELDKVADMFIRDHQAIPGFYKLYGFPNSICTSINEAVVHGIPTNEPLKDGDIISVDIGIIKNQYWGDSAFTFAVGEVSEEVKQLLQVTKQSLYLGIEKAIAGNRIGDIGATIQDYTQSFGYGVVRDLVGHGLGKDLHEEPQVPNYGKKGTGLVLQEGLVIAIEPMINMGTHKVKTLKDGWSIVTGDLKYSAHFEHTIVVRKNKAEVLSSFELVEKALAVN